MHSHALLSLYSTTSVFPEQLKMRNERGDLFNQLGHPACLLSIYARLGVGMVGSMCHHHVLLYPAD